MAGARLWVDPLVAGFLGGHVIYDLVHYSVHNFRIAHRIGKSVRQNHMRHHYAESDKRFGITSPLWDYIFGTRPDSRPLPR